MKKIKMLKTSHETEVFGLPIFIFTRESRYCYSAS